jgi:hypothetical protein
LAGSDLSAGRDHADGVATVAEHLDKQVIGSAFSKRKRKKRWSPQAMLPMNRSTDQRAALMKSEGERIARIVELLGAKEE